MPKRYTVLYMPIDAHGHVNACLGTAQVLRDRGHRIVFAVDYAWRDILTREGFEVELHGQENDKEFWPQFFQKNAKYFRLSPIDTFEKFLVPIIKVMIDTHIERDSQYREIINRIKPDIIVVDNIVCSPAMINSGIPWVSQMSANPLLYLTDKRTPPAFSGTLLRVYFQIKKAQNI